jgi:hypothetical protein
MLAADAHLGPALAAAVFLSVLAQTLLDEGFRSELDVEEVCRAFLDLAKAWSRRLIEMMYNDSGGQGAATEALADMHTDRQSFQGGCSCACIATRLIAC